MKGFEYGVYSPGDLARLEGHSKYQRIASYDADVVYFDDGTFALTSQVVEVLMHTGDKNGPV
jgi:hypothetical protein